MGPRIEPEDRASVLGVARYGARALVAPSRLRYDAERAEVELVSDASDGQYAGVTDFDALEFLARRVDHISAKGEVRVRYYGAYASRRRGWWRRRGVVLAGAWHENGHDTEHEAEPWPALDARRRRWAELLRKVFRVDVEGARAVAASRCGANQRSRCSRASAEGSNRRAAGTARFQAKALLKKRIAREGGATPGPTSRHGALGPERPTAFALRQTGRPAESIPLCQRG